MKNIDLTGGTETKLPARIDYRALYHDLDVLHEDFKRLDLDFAHIVSLKSQLGRIVFGGAQ
jgi:hypothetical protein